ncbi:hypothetical protein NLX83_37190 [Allokutzneria sp. A3M-2-11 16]|uniref:hypothetical protein n=1 Tax=Allokutzneria sp. A3M-2-11 16 TaxID=2962043 RepID=UPI0020B8C941|nr:hypothetical protein [Allokutzneria sp. A3M-2-11 16]MCP3804916.1 hypothetical protein [Allokutzneria sp. A3M-2-11 16]
MNFARMMVAVTAAALVAVPGTAEAAACAWKPVPLPMPAGAVQADATAADGVGGHVGTAEFAGSEQHVVRWSGSTITDYGRVPGTFPNGLTAREVNRGGVIVGNASQLYSSVAFRSAGTALARLPLPAGTTSSRANAINDRGDAVGWAVLPDRTRKAVLWPADRPETAVELGGLPTGFVEAVDIDEDGTILVRHSNDQYNSTSYKWRDGVATALRAPAGVKSAEATGIAAGRVSGTFVYQDDSRRAGLWDAAGAPQVLPQGNRAESVNRGGLVVGVIDAGAVPILWRSTTVESVVRTSEPLYLGKVGDDGTIPGHYTRQPNNRHSPVVLRCS